jgi:nucleoside-diphosphate-sugar epimerase
VGRLLSDWVGRPGADLPVFLGALKKHGAVRLVSTTARGDHGATDRGRDLGHLDPAGSAAVHRLHHPDVGRRVVAGPQGARDLTRAVEQLTGLVGRVAMRDLIRDTSTSSSATSSRRRSSSRARTARRPPRCSA